MKSYGIGDLNCNTIYRRVGIHSTRALSLRAENFGWRDKG